MTKKCVAVSIDDEIAKWFKDHGVNRSKWFTNQFRAFVEQSDPDFRAVHLAEKYQRLRNEIDEIENTFRELTGQTDIDEFLRCAQTRSALEEEKHIIELYEAMGKDHKRFVMNGDNDSGLLSWIEARAPDFGIALSPKEILSRLRDNGRNRELEG